MPASSLKRPVVRLDTSNQLRLFSAAVPKAVDPGGPTVDGVRFVSPDPREILFGGLRLDEHLKQIGERDALVVRTFLGEQDWSAFEADYRPGGRPPYAPRAVLGLILYGLMRGITSLRDLERLARVDLGCMWVSGGILPDHSIIGRFIQRHEELLSEAFFMALTQRVLKVTRSDPRVVAGDGTVIEAAGSHYRLLKAEAVQQGRAQARRAADANPADDALAERARKAEAVEQAFQARQWARAAQGKRAPGLQISPSDPDAVVQPLKDKKRFAPSYKPSVLANPERVIVAQALDASSETRVVRGMLDQARQHGPVETALFDAGYHTDAVIEATGEREIELLCPEGRSQGLQWTKQSRKYYPKSQFHYDPKTDRYRCPQGHCLTRISAYQGNARYPGYVVYGSPACSGCSQRERCTKNQQGRRVKRYAGDAAKEALRAHMDDPEVRQRYRKRQAMVEPVFSVLRLRQGLNRFRRRGLKAVRCEFALHAMAYNLSRAVALGDAFLAILVRLRGHQWGRCIFPVITRSIAESLRHPDPLTATRM